MSRKVTMQDIANNLGISRSLVSRALADSYTISEKTKALVRDEAGRLGYVVKEHRVVKTKGNNNIVVYIPRASMLDQGFAIKVLTGVEDAASRHGLHTTLCLTENQYVPSSSTARGIIVIAYILDSFLSLLKTTGLPIVLLDSVALNAQTDNICADNYNGMYNAMRYLDEHGHRNIVFAGHYNFAYSFKQRYHAFYDYIHRENSNMEGKEATRFSPGSLFDEQQLLDILHSDFHVTAIVCMNDPTAVQVYSLLNKHLLRIPEDISVIGFDNIEQSTWLLPPLTTVDVPKTALGEEVVSMLLTKMDQPTKYNRLVCLETTLVERSSVKTISPLK